jgi:hypothetical protein
MPASHKRTEAMSRGSTTSRSLAQISRRSQIARNTNELKAPRLRDGTMSPVAFWITKAFPDTPCQELRRSTGPCTTPALYVIHVGDIVYPVCGEHLRAFKQDVGLRDE